MLQLNIIYLVLLGLWLSLFFLNQEFTLICDSFILGTASCKEAPKLRIVVLLKLNKVCVATGVVYIIYSRLF